MSKPKQVWAVMTALEWESCSIRGNQLTGYAKGPHRFIPLFNSKVSALAWNNGNAYNVQKVVLNVKKD